MSQPENTNAQVAELLSLVQDVDAAWSVVGWGQLGPLAARRSPEEFQALLRLSLRLDLVRRRLDAMRALEAGGVEQFCGCGQPLLHEPLEHGSEAFCPAGASCSALTGAAQ